MTIADVFKRLNTPLANSRWSWGSVRESDGVVVLRVWQDRKIWHEKRLFMRLTNHEKFVEKETDSGYKERNEHVELIRNGSKCLMIMCIVIDAEASPRKIKSYNSKELFVGGEVLELNGDTWIELESRMPLKDAVE